MGWLKFIPWYSMNSSKMADFYRWIFGGVMIVSCGSQMYIHFLMKQNLRMPGHLLARVPGLKWCVFYKIIFINALTNSWDWLPIWYIKKLIGSLSVVESLVMPSMEIAKEWVWRISAFSKHLSASKVALFYIPGHVRWSLTCFQVEKRQTDLCKKPCLWPPHDHSALIFQVRLRCLNWVMGRVPSHFPLSCLGCV